MPRSGSPPHGLCVAYFGDPELPKSGEESTDPLRDPLRGVSNPTGLANLWS